MPINKVIAAPLSAVSQNSDISEPRLVGAELHVTRELLFSFTLHAFAPKVAFYLDYR